MQTSAFVSSSTVLRLPSYWIRQTWGSNQETARLEVCQTMPFHFKIELQFYNPRFICNRTSPCGRIPKLQGSLKTQLFAVFAKILNLLCLRSRAMVFDLSWSWIGDSYSLTEFYFTGLFGICCNCGVNERGLTHLFPLLPLNFCECCHLLFEHIILQDKHLKCVVILKITLQSWGLYRLFFLSPLALASHCKFRVSAK